MKDINISVETIKRHAKRLHKVLIEEGLVSNQFKLTHAQEIFSKSLGCNNWFELNESLKKDKIEKLPSIEKKTIISVLTQYLNKSQGNIDKKFWYALMSYLQIMEEKDNLDKVVSAFTNKFNEYPKYSNINWEELEKDFNQNPELINLIQNSVQRKKIFPNDYKPSVFIIDSSLTILKASRLFLSQTYEVFIFEKLNAAQEQFKINKPDLIICEIDSPSLTDKEINSGFRFIKELDDKLKKIPVIFLSHKKLTSSLEKNHVFLEKPFTKDTLNEKVYNILLKYNKK